MNNIDELAMSIRDKLPVVYQPSQIKEVLLNGRLEDHAITYATTLLADPDALLIFSLFMKAIYPGPRDFEERLEDLFQGIETLVADFVEGNPELTGKPREYIEHFSARVRDAAYLAARKEAESELDSYDAPRWL